MLASLALYDDDPASINKFEAGMMNVTADDIQKTAQEYLRSSNRTILVLEAGAAEQKPGVAAND